MIYLLKYIGFVKEIKSLETLETSSKQHETQYKFLIGQNANSHCVQNVQLLMKKWELVSPWVYLWKQRFNKICITTYNHDLNIL